MTVHRFPQKPRVRTTDVEFARTGMENARHGKEELESDIERHEHIIALVGTRLSEGVQARMRRELEDLRDMRADAAADEAAWQEVVQALVCLDMVDDRPSSAGEDDDGPRGA